MIVGIDPGLHGGFASIGDNGICVEPMPIIGDELNLPAITTWLAYRSADIKRVYLEKVHAFHMASKSSMLKFGRTVGALEGICAGLSIPYEFVRPTVWVKEIHKGMDQDLSPKERSLLVAQRLFPAVDFKATEKSKKPHDGMVDALLIAEYGRRQFYRGSA